MRADFFDTNIILYLLDDGPKADMAAGLLAHGGVISVQVLNEALVNCIRKAGMSWQEAGDFLAGVRDLCEVIGLSARIHDVGLAVGERYGFSVYDAMIVSAALTSGCERLYTEDLQHGQLIEGRLRIVNPFRQ
ncbi:PIN domain-containing protein [Paracoccus yeei]|uniref:Ribonuclease VapC n=1 Tax=Paracoccus yeei TaxID=147645 RepID=A0A2D2C6X9_9RHOB|nr:PIN domain-containing protein [Paracoccus yeei]ATQ58227.1 VapC toxin family PIN domain ribonuclease [Paracoccus yeei]